MAEAADVVPATRPEDIAAAKALFIEYADWLGVDLCFQGFEAEMARFPEGYRALFIGRVNSAPVGAVGLIERSPGVCEMKRLYVRPSVRGSGLGEKLSRALITEAERLGYREMVLDTLHRLEAARRLYGRLGFETIDAYYDNPLENVIYMRRLLAPASA